MAHDPHAHVGEDIHRDVIHEINEITDTGISTFNRPRKNAKWQALVPVGSSSLRDMKLQLRESLLCLSTCSTFRANCLYLWCFTFIYLNPISIGKYGYICGYAVYV